MATYGDPKTATGKAFVQKQVVTTATVMALPIVKEDELKSIQGAINIARFSGKKRGAMVLMESKADQTLHIAVAQGPEPSASWNIAELGTPVTPEV